MTGLPDYIIIGAQKCGTTSMMHYIADHPDVGNVPRHEIHFFSREYRNGLTWYREQLQCELGKLCGEKSPSYLIHPAAPRRMKRCGVQAKFIVLLRNPVERTLSHYKMLRRYESVKCSFESFMWKSHRISRWGRAVLRRSYYASQLKRWFAVFPQDRFIILRSEDFFKHTVETMNLVWDFLNLPMVNPNVYHDKTYVGIEEFNRDVQMVVSDKSREWLVQHFAPHNARLEKLLEREMKW